MRCQVRIGCQNKADWIVEYLESNLVVAVCQEHVATCIVKEQRVIHLSSITCQGPYVQELQKELAKT